ncbi:MAG: LptF/LptG family permease, partial [Acidobacteriota bacterium]
FARQTVRLEAPPAVAARLRLLDEPPQKGLREQTPWELRRTIRDFERHPNPRVRLLLTREARMELHKQFATPCASLVLALLAVPLGLLNRRSPRSASFALSLAVILLYWVLMTAGEDLLRKEVLASPFVAAWAPNLFFLGLGAALSAPRLRGLLVASGIAARHWARRLLQPLRGRGFASPDVDQRTLPLPSRRAQRWVPLLDWLVAGTFARILGFILLSAYVLYALVVAKGLIDNLLENELPMVLLLEYVAYRSPSLIVEYVLPVASLVAVLLTFAHLSRTGELLAMQAGGISRRRAALPVVVVTAALCLVSVLATETVLPAANQRAQERRAEIRGKRSPRTYYHPERRWVFGDEGRLYAYRRARSGGTLLEGFSLVKIDRERFRLQERWYASRAVWDGAAWQLRDGWVRKFPQGGGEEFATFEQRRLALPEDPAFLAQEWAAPKNMNFVDLRRYVRDLAGAGYDVRELRVDLQTRLHTPWLALFMVLMALPLALRVSRHGHLAALALSLAIGIVYYPLLQVSAKLGELGTLPVSVAVWGPSLVFVAAGLAMLPRVRT